MENDTRTPRDRINADFMRRMMELEKENELNEMNQLNRQNEMNQLNRQNEMNQLTPRRQNTAENEMPNSQAEENFMPLERPLAMVYSPRQSWRELYDPEMGFTKGTLFKELDKPFMGGGGAENRRSGGMR